MIISIVVVLFIGCSSETNLSRLSEEYFPFPDTGSFWVYTDSANNTVTVSVTQVNYFYEGRYCSVWDFNGTNFYAWKDNGSVKTHRKMIKDFGGYSYIVENRWADLFKLPFIDGDRWSEIFTNSLNIAGSIYDVKITTGVTLAKLDNYTVPAGTYNSCYRVQITENIEESSSLTGNHISTYTRSYVLAPSKGIIFFSDSTGEYSLTDIELN